MASVRRSPIPIAPKPSTVTGGATKGAGGGGGGGAVAGGGGGSGMPIVPKLPGGGVTITPINPSLLQQMKKGHSPVKASPNIVGLAQTKGTPPLASTVKKEGSSSPKQPASKASTGTQTSPHRASTQQQLLLQPSPTLVTVSSSPLKPGITLTAASGLSTNLLGSCSSSGVTGNASSVTVVTPSKITIGSLLSPRGSGRGAAAAVIIPTSPPIPSVTVTPSASPARTPQRTPATYGSSSRQTLGGTSMLSLTPGTPGSLVGSAARPKRTGSLALFYRKMYQLAYIRIRDLSERLELDTEFVQK